MKYIYTLILVFIVTAHIFGKDTIKIGLMGDVMLGRLVNEKISRTSYKYPWGNFIDLLHANDINIINLETTLTKSRKAVAKTFNYKATPDKAKTLVEGNITVANLANNHILDFGEPGLKDTIAALDKARIAHVGAGKNISDAQKPVIITKNGIKVGILGFTDNEPTWVAQTNKAGTNYIKVDDHKTIVNLIKQLRPQVDILIVSLHWGPNMKELPSEHFIKFAHKLIHEGVDIIHGHSAHILQPVEIYRGKVILYDTGDFIDDYDVDKVLRNDQTALFVVTVNKDRPRKLQLIPGTIANMQVNKASAPDAHAILQKERETSDKFFKTNINSRGFVTKKKKKKLD